MMAAGKDCSNVFPSVVKNVAAKNGEMRKMVFIYLSRYAESHQDLALLSISTIQRGMRDPNQLIRASALRILMSIRVPMVIPILLMSVTEASSDLSPFVRKTVAQSLPKLYDMDDNQKPQLVDLVEKLLKDHTTLVAGTAVQAFEEICPERIDLIHKHFKKLCSILLDIDEWGQMSVINMLTRYARTQFLDPNVPAPHKRPNKDNSSDGSKSDSTIHSSDEDELCTKKDVNSQLAEADYQLLVSSCRALLHSKNSAVVIAVCQLYFHCGKKSELTEVSRALIGLLRHSRESQYLVLTQLAHMVNSEPVKMCSSLEPHLKRFFVFSMDPLPCKLLKLDILCHLACEANSAIILRELQAYVLFPELPFVSATIHGIGRIACKVPQVADVCLAGLVRLISRQNEHIVGDSVVVMRSLLQVQSKEHEEIVTQLTSMLDSMTLPTAKASILWLVGEYFNKISKLAPDVLRKAVKNFAKEATIVKMQILNLATKLCINNPGQTHLLAQYVCNQAWYDKDYDIRDRSRVIKALLFPSQLPNENGENTYGYLARHAKKLFLAPKPSPILTGNETLVCGNNNLRLGSLSQVVNRQLQDYQELPEWPKELPDPSLRQVQQSVSSEPFASSNNKQNRLSTSSDSTEESSTSSEELPLYSSTGIVEPKEYQSMSASEASSEEKTDNGSSSESEGSTQVVPKRPSQKFASAVPSHFLQSNSSSESD
ncbi:AP-3 complex subunit beta-2 [Cichlidogyrus casuarinus]|uniref:AP complex subunit beta n=1 Tax=Cichlidogyrus casuarinus TaxID=1844966 RepID=A0ABD2QL79_9PLAT